MIFHNKPARIFSEAATDSLAAVDTTSHLPQALKLGVVVTSPVQQQGAFHRHSPVQTQGQCVQQGGLSASCTCMIRLCEHQDVAIDGCALASSVYDIDGFALGPSVCDIAEACGKRTRLKDPWPPRSRHAAAR